MIGWERKLTSGQHLTTVADTEREGIKTLEECFKGLTSTVVHEDGLSPAVTGTEDITARVSTSAVQE
jgi:hypothetical protein